MTMKTITVDMGGGKSSCVILEDVSPTLTCTHYEEPVVAYEDTDREEVFPLGRG